MIVGVINWLATCTHWMSIYIFEGSYGHFVVLIAGSVLIGGQKGKAWGNIRVCAGGIFYSTDPAEEEIFKTELAKTSK